MTDSMSDNETSNAAPAVDKNLDLATCDNFFSYFAAHRAGLMPASPPQPLPPLLTIRQVRLTFRKVQFLPPPPLLSFLQL
jgi:hypothetical protein